MLILVFKSFLVIRNNKQMNNSQSLKLSGRDLHQKKLKFLKERNSSRKMEKRKYHSLMILNRIN